MYANVAALSRLGYFEKVYTVKGLHGSSYPYSKPSIKMYLVIDYKYLYIEALMSKDRFTIKTVYFFMFVFLFPFGAGSTEPPPRLKSGPPPRTSTAGR